MDIEEQLHTLLIELADEIKEYRSNLNRLKFLIDQKEQTYPNQIQLIDTLLRLSNSRNYDHSCVD